MNEQEKLITVCDRCLQATCWRGIFLCDNADIAGTKQIPISELRKLNREHESYWKTNEELLSASLI